MNKLVKFEIAKLLKEKGFDKPVKNYYLQEEKGNYLHEGFEDSYWGDNRIVNWNKDVVGIKPFEGFLSAPTIAEVVMWLYEKHGIWISLDWMTRIKPYNSGFISHLRGTNKRLNQDNFIVINDTLKPGYEVFNSPTEAYEAAIEYTLNNLI